jgi:periplasmic divalent cation tolerance protein
MHEIVLALSTVPEDFDARSLARALVEAGVAACVTVLPAGRSIYRWGGAVHDDGEQQLVMKTTRAALDALWAALKARHPYDVPEFIVVPVEGGHEPYLRWVGETVASPERLP